MEALIQTADKLLCESWNERMWADGEPIDPSPSVDQAVNGGFAWLEIECSRCKTKAGRPSGRAAPSADHICPRPIPPRPRDLCTLQRSRNRSFAERTAPVSSRAVKTTSP